MNETQKRREACTHPRIEKERTDFGWSTGEYVCIHCGEDFRTRAEWEEARAAAKPKCGGRCPTPGCGKPCARPEGHPPGCYCSDHIYQN